MLIVAEGHGLKAGGKRYGPGEEPSGLPAAQAAQLLAAGVLTEVKPQPQRVRRVVSKPQPHPEPEPPPAAEAKPEPPAPDPEPEAKPEPKPKRKTTRRRATRRKVGE